MKVRFGTKNHLIIVCLKTPKEYLFILKLQTTKQKYILYGAKLGTHVGGFTPFNFEITDHIKEKENFLIVKVDNKRLKDGVPTLNNDWWNYGGLSKAVKLISTPANFVADYFIQLNPNNNKDLTGFVALNGKAISIKKVEIIIPELNIYEQFITDAKGKAII